MSDTPSSGSVNRKVAILCANNVQVDSRVRKIGRSAKELGFEPLIIGISRSKEFEDTEFDGVRTLLVNNSDQLFRHFSASHLNAFPWGVIAYRSKIQVEFNSLNLMAEYRAIKATVTLGKPNLFRVYRYKVNSYIHKMRRRATSKEYLAYVKPNKVRYSLRRVRLKLSAGSRWAYYEPTLLDFSALMIPELEKFSPDVIHANDTATIVAALVYKRRFPNTKIMYDIHEWVHGLPGLDPLKADVYGAVQDRYIHGFDALLTVSPGLADLVEERYGVRPEVIENVPWITDKANKHSVRERIGLDEDQPLMVYSGWIAQERGIDTVIEGLVHLPEVHFVLVAGRSFGYVENLLAASERLGVSERVHVVGYVEPHEISGYLSSCDIGLIPLEHAPNHEIAIITKYYEYLHAGLPIVCSDVREMAALTKLLEVGQVFIAGDVTDFVKSVKEILRDRDLYRGRLTPELRKQWSWQEQSKKLVKLYS